MSPTPPPPAAPTPPISGYAIASLVFGLIGGVVFGIAFGIVALRRVRRGTHRGRGLAIAGISLSCLWVLVVGLAFAVSLLTDAERDPSGGIVERGEVSVFDLRLGTA